MTQPMRAVHSSAVAMTGLFEVPYVVDLRALGMGDVLVVTVADLDGQLSLVVRRVSQAGDVVLRRAPRVGPVSLWRDHDSFALTWPDGVEFFSLPQGELLGRVPLSNVNSIAADDSGHLWLLSGRTLYRSHRSDPSGAMQAESHIHGLAAFAGRVLLARLMPGEGIQLMTMRAAQAATEMAFLPAPFEVKTK